VAEHEVEVLLLLLPCRRITTSPALRRRLDQCEFATLLHWSGKVRVNSEIEFLLELMHHSVSGDQEADEGAASVLTFYGVSPLTCMLQWNKTLSFKTSVGKHEDEALHDHLENIASHDAGAFPNVSQLSIRC
jgi:hypothetical protein